MATTTLISIEEYLNTSYDPDCEYVDGEVIQRNMGESDHAGLQTLIALWFGSREKQLGIYVTTELRIQVAPGHFRVPDLTVTTRKIRGRILREPPFLCIEVLSPEDRTSRTEEKIDDYLKFGVAYVWLIDPRKKLAWSYTKDERRQAASLLTTSDPRIELPIAELFTALSERLDLSDE